MWQQAEGRTRSACTRQSTTTTHAFRRPQVAKQRSKHDDKQVYYGIVNLRPDELVKLGTNLDKGEQELFHKIVRGLPPRKTGARHAKPTRCAPPAQLDEIDSSEEKEIDEMGAHNKRLDCTPRVSSEDATSCLQQCARHPAPHAHLPGRRSHAPHSPLTRPSRLLRAGLSTASGCTRATMAASRSASESSCNECIHRTRPPARREALLN